VRDRYSLVVGLIFAAVIVIAVIFTALSGAVSGSSARIIGVVVAIAIGGLAGLAGLAGILWIAAKFSLAVPACMLEGHGAIGALRRSSFLAKDSILRIILIYFLMGVLGIVLSLLFSVPGQLLGMGGKLFLLSTLLEYFGSFVAGVLAGPISTIAIALVYYDQRVRKEAFDLQLMMDTMVQPAAAQPPSPQAAEPPPLIG